MDNRGRVSIGSSILKFRIGNFIFEICPDFNNSPWQFMNGVLIIDNRPAYDVTLCRGSISESSWIRAKSDTSAALDPCDRVPAKCLESHPCPVSCLRHHQGNTSARSEFGLATNTYDLEGTPPAGIPFASSMKSFSPSWRTSPESLEKRLTPFPRNDRRRPRSHDSSRRGEVVENAPVPLEVRGLKYVFARLPFNSRCLRGGTTCEAWRHDLGQRLGCGTFESLRLLRSGDFGIEEASRMECERLQHHASGPAVSNWPALIVSGLEERRVRQGNPYLQKS